MNRLWILLIIVLFALPYHSIENVDGVGRDEYIYYPTHNRYELLKIESGRMIPISIHFSSQSEWTRLMEREFPGYGPSSIGGLCSRFYDSKGRVIKYEIEIPYESGGSINLDSLGHEIAHVLDHSWHK